jgi:hypothetical protein
MLEAILDMIRSVAEKIHSLIEPINRLLEIPYMIAFAPMKLILLPVRACRIVFDKISGKLFHSTSGRFMALFANVPSGWVYNFLNSTIMKPIIWLIDKILYVFPWLREDYAWMNMCLETRLYFILSLLYKGITKILLLIPCLGWVLWIVMLPFGYFLSIWSIWVTICPVETMMPFLAPTAFPSESTPGCVGNCKLVI